MTERAVRPSVRQATRAGALVLVVGLLLGLDVQPAPSSVALEASDVGLVPTQHRPIPTDWDGVWLVPEPGTAPGAEAKALAEAVRRLDGGDASGALAALGRVPARDSIWRGYVELVAGRALRRLDRGDQAAARFAAAQAAAGDRALLEAALLARAELAESSGQPAAALELYQRALTSRPASPDVVQAAILRTAVAAGDAASVQAAAMALFYDHPTSVHAASASALVAGWRVSAPPASAAEFTSRDMTRADRLFEARQYAEARAAYDAMRATTSGPDAVKAAVRSAAADFWLGRHRAAAEGLAPWLDQAPHAAEARYFHLRSLRALGQRDPYVAAVRDLADRYPTSPWAAEALNHLASYFIVDDQDDRALEVFARVLDQHPTHRHAERAAWKLGWAHYRQRRFAEAAAVFERGAANAPRSDYRPSWLYWSGRAREQAGDRDDAVRRYRVTVADYQNSYYGRLALDALTRLRVRPDIPAVVAGAASSSVPGEHRDLVRALIAGGLLDLAAAEVEFAQRRWGNAPALDATMAYLHNRRGDLRRGITLMRRAYPQFMAAGGEKLPAALQQVIFPVSFGGLIDRYARQRELDPHLVAALVAQESSFQADARSVANAIGLMQILPSTGRRLARAEGVRRFSAARLTDPDVNVRLGTRYFATLVDTLGGEHLALASYNAGKSRVDRWLAERPGLPRDEFIDDIPFPETQNYVKRILGTADDYRRLYGDAGLVAAGAAARAPASVVPVSKPAKPRPARPSPTRKKRAARGE